MCSFSIQYGSLKLAEGKRLGTVSYSESIVTMALSSSFPRLTDMLVENRNFFLPYAFDTLVTGMPVGVLPYRLVCVVDGRERVTAVEKRVLRWGEERSCCDDS